MKKLPPTALPHSWSIDLWPRDVYPGTANRGKYVVRANRAALIACGALTRCGRDLVVIGPNYAGWLARQSDRVQNFEIAPNRPRATTSSEAA